MTEPVPEDPSWSSGMSMVSDAEDLWQAVASGSWKDAAIDGIGVGLDVTTAVLDPLGALAAAGIGWLIEHVRPLHDLLGGLTGDPDAVAAQARQWQEVALSVQAAADDLERAGAADARWQGPAADAFARSTAEHADAMRAAGTAAATLGTATAGAGEVVSTVRAVVRDLISQLVATLIVRVPEWAAEEGLSLGLATPFVAASAVSLIARVVDEVVEVVKGAIRSLVGLGTLLGRVRQLFERLATVFARRAAAETAPMEAGADAPRLAGPHQDTAPGPSAPGPEPHHDSGPGSSAPGPGSPPSRIQHALEPGPVKDATGRTGAHVDRHGFLTDGVYKVRSGVHDAHRPGTALPGKSVFFPDVDPDQLALEAARRADKDGLWAASNEEKPAGSFRNKAKIVLDAPIGTHHESGLPTSVLNVYRRRSHFVHISPGSPQ